MIEFATLDELADEVGLQIQDSSSTKAVQIKSWLNRHYAQVARQHRWPELLRVSEENFSFSTGQKYLYLPKEVEAIYLIFPQNGMPPLQGQSLDQLIEKFSTTYNTNGLTIQFAEAGEVGYSTDFYTTGERLALSHTGSGTIEAVVRGTITSAPGVAGGSEVVEVVSVLQSTGGTTTNTFTDLGGVSVQELADGDVVTVSGVTTSRSYATIASGERSARYKRVRLMQPSAASDAVTLIWKKRVARLKEDNQAIEIPCASILIDMTVATMLAQKREYGGASLHYQRAQAEKEELKSAVSIDTTSIQQAVPGISLRRGYRDGGSY